MNSAHHSNALKAVEELPAPFQPVFNFRYFNSLQSDCFYTCFYSDANMVISAPTGSGKTVLFELCILSLLSKFITAEGNFIHHKGTLKTIYIAPSKALVQEKFRHWTQKLGHLQMNCLELTGDNEYYTTKSIQDADIILTTPEKFDAVTRYRIKDGGLGFFSDIALVLIDEVHFLNDPRGATLEAIVSRIKMLAQNPELKNSALSHVRFLAVSATIPNLNDIAEWLMVPSEGIRSFGEEMRPVQLTTKVFGYAPAKNDFLFEKRLQNYIYDLLMQYSSGKSCLVFCSTRKGAQEAAQHLSHIAMKFGNSSPFIKSREQQERLREASLSCGDKQMQSYILYGVGYHNGGLSMKDRSLVEGLFLNGDIQILCTTNTLAHGINLPAHTVVIKSTQYFNKEKGMYVEYERSMILQMCGRAGRPPFDDTGTVIIMTRKETVHLYENLLSGCETVESQLLPSITEHLTAEIVQSTVADIMMAIQWMKCSYLFVRMKKNPKIYTISKEQPAKIIENHLQDICVKKVNELAEYQIVWTDEDGYLLKPLEPGNLMTKYYLKFDTMKHIIQAASNCSVEDALHILCQAEEISWIQLRRNEKKSLNEINHDKNGRLRFHVLDEKGKRKKRIQTREEKIFILVNDCLTGDPAVHELSMSQDANSICTNGSRIARCMKEYFLFKKSYKGALNSTLLSKCLHQKLWENSPYLLKQLPGIGMVTAKALLSMGVNSFETLSDADPRKIEMVTGRKYPFGNHIKDSLLSLPPKVEMAVEESDGHKLGKSKLLVTLTRLSPPLQSIKRHYADMIVGIEDDNLILFHEKVRLEDFASPYCATVLYESPQLGKLTIKADLIFEDLLGIDQHQKIIVTPKVDMYAVPRDRANEHSSFQPIDDDHTTKDETNCPSIALKEAFNFNELIKNSISMPSFNLMDEELEGGEAVVEPEDDDCKIISEKKMFDHIREKAKHLPVLPLASDTCTPTLEAFALIRKRTREKHLELENETEIIEVTDGREASGSKVDSPYPEIKGSEENRHIFGDDGNLNDSSLMDTEIWNIEDANVMETQNTKSSLTEESIFDHIKKKSKNYPELNSLRPDEIWNVEDANVIETRSTKSSLTRESIFDHIKKKSKNYPELNSSRPNIFCSSGESSRNDTSPNGGFLDCLHDTVTSDAGNAYTRRNIDFPSEDGSGLEPKMTLLSSPGIPNAGDKSEFSSNTVTGNKQNLSSTNLSISQCCPLAMGGAPKENLNLNDSFLMDTEIWNGEDANVTDTRNTKSRLTQQSIFDHIKKKSNCPELNSLKPDIFSSYGDSSRKDAPTYGGPLDCSRDTGTLDARNTYIRRNIGFPSEDASGVERKMTLPPSPGIPIVRDNSEFSSNTVTDNVKNLSSTNLSTSQCCPLAMGGAPKENSNFGLQSVFSFLF